MAFAMRRCSWFWSAGRHAKDFQRRARVNVLVARESFDQQRVLGKMGEHAQLNLRIVGGDQLAAGIGDKGRADAQSELIANGNVLQVGIGGGEPPGARHGLVERSVQAAGFRLDEFGQRVNVSGFQLGARAVFDDLARQIVLFGERLPAPTASVEYCPLFFSRLPPGSLSFSNRISPSCLGESMSNGSPARS